MSATENVIEETSESAVKIYNRLTNEWVTPPGRVYVVNPAPEITGDDLIVAHRRINNVPGWVVTHAETSTAIARGATRKEAIRTAADVLGVAGRETYLKAVQSHRQR